MESNSIIVGEMVAINDNSSLYASEYLCGSDDDCGCEGGEGSCECGYDPECE